jgi:hypothetical protein
MTRRKLTGTAALRVARRGERATHNVLICTPSSTKSDAIFEGPDAYSQAWRAVRGSKNLERISSDEIKDTIVCVSGTGTGFPLSDLLETDVTARADMLSHAPTVDGSVTMSPDGMHGTIESMDVLVDDWTHFNTCAISFRESFSFESMPHDLIYCDLVAIPTARAPRRNSSADPDRSADAPTSKRPCSIITPTQNSKQRPWLISRDEVSAAPDLSRAAAEVQDVVAAPDLARSVAEVQDVVDAPDFTQQLIVARNVAAGFRSAFDLSQRTVGALRFEAERAARVQAEHYARLVAEMRAKDVQHARIQAELRAELAAAHAEIDVRIGHVAKPPTRAEAAALLSDLEGPNYFLPVGGNSDALDADFSDALDAYVK